MNEKEYCPNCKKMVDTRVTEKYEALSVRGQEITLKVKMRICKECGEPLVDDELDDISLKQFYDEYRRLNNLLFPEEIKKIREKYNMSQTEFAKLLGMGEKTIARYENGAIQERVHDNLIRVVNNSNVFADLLERNSNYIESNKNTRDISKMHFALKSEDYQKSTSFEIRKEKLLGGKRNAGKELFA